MTLSFEIDLETIMTVFFTNPQERIVKLKEHLMLLKINHDLEIMKLKTLKEAHLYCVLYKTSAQQYGPLIEKFIRQKYYYSKNRAKDCIGDCSKNGENIEVKVSLGGANHNKFNFVQIRPSHDCDTYLLTAYHISIDNVETEGELYIFKLSKEDMKKIIVSHGGYAHGTIRENGKITLDSLYLPDNKKEYAIRPKFNDACWKLLLNHRIIESDL